MGFNTGLWSPPLSLFHALVPKWAFLVRIALRGIVGLLCILTPKNPANMETFTYHAWLRNILLVHYKRSNHEFFTGQDMFFLQICLSSTFLSPSSCRSLVRKTCRCDSHSLFANILSILSTQSKVDVSWAAGTWNSRAERCILGVGICLRFSMGTLDSSFHQTFGGFDDLIHGRLSWPVKGSGEHWLYA